MSVDKNSINQWISDNYGGDDFLIVFTDHLIPSKGINGASIISNHPFCGLELVKQNCSPATKGQKPTIYFNFYKKGSL